MDVFDQLEQAPRKDVFDEVSSSPAQPDVFDQVETQRTDARREAKDYIQRTTSVDMDRVDQRVAEVHDLSKFFHRGPGLEGTPVLSPDDPRFDEVATGVNTGIATAQAIALPHQLDFSEAVPVTERFKQINAAEDERLALEEKLQANFSDKSVAGELWQAKLKERRLKELHAQTEAGSRPNFEQIQAGIQEKFGAISPEDAPNLFQTGSAKILEGLHGMAAPVADIMGLHKNAESLREDMADLEKYAGARKGAGAEVVRGITGVVPLVVGLPQGKLGALQATLRASAQSYSATLERTGDKKAAFGAAVQTAPEIAAFMLAGAGAGKAVAAMLPKNAGAMATGLANFAGAEIANIGVSNVLQALHGGEYGLSNFSADTLFALFHGWGGYKGKVNAATRERIANEIRSRGWSQEQIDAPFEAGKETPAFMLIKAPGEVQPFPREGLMDKAAMDAEVQKQGGGEAPAAQRVAVIMTDYGKRKIEKRVGDKFDFDSDDDLAFTVISTEGISLEKAQRLNPKAKTGDVLVEGIDKRDGLTLVRVEGEAPPAPTELSVHDIVPTLKIEGQPVRGQKGDGHRDIINRFKQDNPNSPDGGRHVLIEMDFETKGNPNYFSVPKSAEFPTGEMSREQLEAKFGISDAQGLKRLQDKTPEPQRAAPAGEPSKSEGPGGAGIGDPVFNQGEPVGAWNEQVRQQRRARNLPDLVSEARKVNTETWDKLSTKNEEDPSYAPRLVEEIEGGQKKILTDEEQGTLLWQQVDLRNKRDMATQRAADEKTYSPEERADYDRQADFFEKELQRNEEAGRKIGTEWGRSGQFRQQMAREDYTLANMESRKRRSKGEPLTPEERATIKKQSEEIQATEEAGQKREAELKDADSLAAAREALAKAAKIHPKVLEWAEKKVSQWEEAGVAAWERFRSKMGRTSAGVDPTLLSDLVIYARGRIARGLVDFAKFSVDVLKGAGEAAKAYLKPAWDKAMKAVGGLDATKTRKKSARQLEEEAKAGQESVSTEDGIKAVLAGGETKLDALAPYIQKLGNEYARSGESVEGVESKLFGLFKDAIPGVTSREIRDVWSDYGKSKAATTDPSKIAQAQRRAEAQKMSALDDLIAKRAALRTGQQRVEASDRYRQLTKQINEKKKELGIVEGDPAKRLKSTLEAMETRVKNRINDLRFEIAKGERTVKGKTAAPTSPKLDAMRKELATVQAEHDAIFGKRKITDEQRLKAALSAAKRAEASASAELANARKGIFTKPAVKGVTRSTELDAIRARTTAVREEVKLLEQMANPPMSEAQKRLDAALVAKERWEQVLAGEIAPGKKLPRESLTQLEEDARAEITAMREMAAELRREEKKSDPNVTKENAQVKALEKAAADYEKRLNEADFAGRGGKKLGPDTARVAAARALRDAARTAFDAAKDATKPKRSDEEIAIQSAKTRLARSNADVTERLAKGDFAKKERKPLDISKDPEAVRLKAENERLKREFNKARFEDEQRKRHAVQKVADVVKNVVLSAPRTLKTAFDASAPFRQGAVISLGDMVFNPIRFGRQMGRMFGSLKSEKYFQERDAAIHMRPNAKNGLYDQSKLDFAYLDGKPTAKEENMRSDFAEKIPGVRMSNRAYLEFLNEQRADTMDAWVDMLGGRNRITAEQAQFLAKAVNDFTGRSKLEVKGAEGVLNWLAKCLFSPRYLLSRIKILSGAPVLRGILTGPKVGFKARAIVAATYGKALVGLGAFYAVASMFFGDKAKISKDPRSSDFGKIRIGKTRIDPMAGLQQIAVLLTRGVGGEVKESDGDIEPVSFNVAAGFARNKLAPFPAAVVDRTFGGGKNVVGDKVTLGGQALDMVTPLSLSDALKTFKTQGPARGTVIQMLNMLGMGTQNY